ncbi:MAG: Ada metal-binding domain-containing protein [Patescibacteria group bacterium]
MRNLLEKIKLYQESLFLVLVIVMVGLIGFGLGRLSAKYSSPALDINSTLVNTTDLDKIATGEPDKTSSFTTQSSPSQGSPPADREVVERKIVGNKQSKIYHFEDCPGALRMSDTNKIFFASILQAQQAGFRPAGNCPGLE